MKKYLLIIEDKKFYDGHGSPDDGGKVAKVAHTDKYNDLDFSKAYYDNDCFDEDDEDVEENWYAEDGYNYDVTFTTYKEITEAEYNEYKTTIANYNKLLK